MSAPNYKIYTEVDGAVLAFASNEHLYSVAVLAGSASDVTVQLTADNLTTASLITVPKNVSQRLEWNGALKGGGIVFTNPYRYVVTTRIE